MDVIYIGKELLCALILVPGKRSLSGSGNYPLGVINQKSRNSLLLSELRLFLVNTSQL